MTKKKATVRGKWSLTKAFLDHPRVKEGPERLCIRARLKAVPCVQTATLEERVQ